MTRRCVHALTMTTALAGLLAVAAACTLPSAPGADVVPEPARLQVEVLRGFGPPRAPLGGLPARVELVVDVSESMREPTREAGPPRWLAAVGAARELIAGTGSETSVGVRALGHVPAHGTGARAAGQACVAGVPLGSGPDVAPALAQLAPRGPGSVARTLAALAAEGVPDRVVVLSDLGDPCGAELCAAAAEVVARGAWIDWVLLGDAAPPACLAALELPASHAGPVAGRLAQEAARFHVEAPARGDGRAEALAEGRDGDEIAVPADRELEVVIALDPPERVGPLELPAGTLARLRVLDFPMADPPRRIWMLDDGRSFDPALPALEIP